jgi:putative nucleotidyltransferase with HDIG domain
MSQDPFSEGLNPQNPILREFRPGPSVVCPLDANGRTVGILGVTRWDTANVLTDSDKEYVQIFANNIATAFERERLDRARRQSYEGAVKALVKAIEVNDAITGDHSDRVSKISVKIARHLGYDDSQLDDIRFGCILHDVGKIANASYYELRKTGPLTAEEYEIIKQHPVRGEEILQAGVFFDLHARDRSLDLRRIVRNHHERWDGKGYPDRLSGDQIPLEAQIVGVADAFDAMTSDRHYRKGMPYQLAVEEIRRCIGTQFSPRAAEAFLQLYEQKEINGNMDK